MRYAMTIGLRISIASSVAVPEANNTASLAAIAALPLPLTTFTLSAYARSISRICPSRWTLAAGMTKDRLASRCCN